MTEVKYTAHRDIRLSPDMETERMKKLRYEVEQLLRIAVRTRDKDSWDINATEYFDIPNRRVLHVCAGYGSCTQVFLDLGVGVQAITDVDEDPKVAEQRRSGALQDVALHTMTVAEYLETRLPQVGEPHNLVAGIHIPAEVVIQVLSEVRKNDLFPSGTVVILSTEQLGVQAEDRVDDYGQVKEWLSTEPDDFKQNLAIRELTESSLVERYGYCYIKK